MISCPKHGMVKAHGAGGRTRCAICNLANVKAWRVRNPERYRELNRKNKQASRARRKAAAAAQTHTRTDALGATDGVLSLPGGTHGQVCDVSK